MAGTKSLLSDKTIEISVWGEGGIIEISVWGDILLRYRYGVYYGYQRISCYAKYKQ